MNYPDWAPESLTKLHKLRAEDRAKGKRFNKSPEDYVANLKADQSYKTHTDSDFENLIQRMYRSSIVLPADESDLLLLKFITDLRMKHVWESLARRKKTDSDFSKFLGVCERALIGWKGEPKITQKERLQILKNIQKLVIELQTNLLQLKDFHFYKIHKLIDDESIRCLLETYNADLSHIEQNKELDFARFYLDDTIPHLLTVLADVRSKAKDYMQKSVTVKKPNSENAKAHYIIRILSAYFQQYYGQPLHETVALTASVMLDVEEIDPDLVRKLVGVRPAFK